MDESLQKTLDELISSVDSPRQFDALTMAAYLALGGVLAFFVRFIYRRFGGAVSNADSTSRIFPLLTLITICVISVVKSSMALSLGLVGALSIVRFRAAIKDPEELVYLFLCIGMGLAIGAGQPLLALVLVSVATAVILIMHFTITEGRSDRLMLTISGDAERYFNSPQSGVGEALNTVLQRYTIQRLDRDGDHGQIRVVLRPQESRRIFEVVSSLQRHLPDCDISFVNLSTLD